MLKAKTRDYLIELVRNARPITAEKYTDTIGALNALEVESESRFREGELCLFWDNDENDSVSGLYKKYDFSKDYHVMLNKSKWKNVSHFTQWNEYKGVKPTLLEGAKGWHVKYADGKLHSVDKNMTHYNWTNEDNKQARAIIEYAYWMGES